MTDREKEERQERKPRREQRKEIFVGCAVTGLNCEGECADIYHKTCPMVYQYYYEPMYKTLKITEQNPKPKKIIKGFRKKELK